MKNFTVILKLNYELLEGFFDIGEKLARFLSNFIVNKTSNKLNIAATKDEIEGIYSELEKLLKNDNFKSMKTDDYKYTFNKGTEIVNVTKPVKQKGNYTFSLEFN